MIRLSLKRKRETPYPLNFSTSQLSLSLSTPKPLSIFLLASLREFILWKNPSKSAYRTPDKIFLFVGRENFIIGPGLGPASPHIFPRCSQTYSWWLLDRVRRALKSEIEGAFGHFDGPAPDGTGMDHGCSICD